VVDVAQSGSVREGTGGLPDDTDGGGLVAGFWEPLHVPDRVADVVLVAHDHHRGQAAAAAPGEVQRATQQPPTEQEQPDAERQAE